MVNKDFQNSWVKSNARDWTSALGDFIVARPEDTADKER